MFYIFTFQENTYQNIQLNVNINTTVTAIAAFVTTDKAWAYHGIWNSSLRVEICGNEIDFKDVDEKSRVCAQRLKNFTNGRSLSASG